MEGEMEEVGRGLNTDEARDGKGLYEVRGWV